MSTPDIVTVGSLRVIAYARDAAGHAHALAFLEAECPAKDAKRLRHWFQVVADHGETGASKEAFRHEVGQLYAFKSFQARVPCFRTGNVWLLTHGFIKKVDRWPHSEITRAERIMAEHLARMRR